MGQFVNCRIHLNNTGLSVCRNLRLMQQREMSRGEANSKRPVMIWNNFVQSFLLLGNHQFSCCRELSNSVLCRLCFTEEDRLSNKKVLEYSYHKVWGFKSNREILKFTSVLLWAGILCFVLDVADNLNFEFLLYGRIFRQVKCLSLSFGQGNCKERTSVVRTIIPLPHWASLNW